jgi:hypothetical protein
MRINSIRLNFEKDIISLMFKGKEFQSFVIDLLHCSPSEYQAASSCLCCACHVWIWTYLSQLARAVQVVQYLENTYQKLINIIHEENTKKNHKRVVSLYVIEIYLDLHKL